MLVNAVVVAGCPRTLSSVVSFYSPLNFFQSLHVVGNEWIPDRAVILKLCMPHFSAFHLWSCVSSGEAQGLVGFAADIGDVGITTKVSGDLDSKVFYLRFCTQDVTVEWYCDGRPSGVW